MRFLFFCLFVCRLFVGKRKKRTLKNKNDKNMTAFFVQILVCVSKERDDLSSLSFFFTFLEKKSTDDDDSLFWRRLCTYSAV